MMETQTREVDDCIMISVDDYTALIECETQKKIVVRMILRGEYVSDDDLRAIFGLGKKPEEPVKAEGE